MVSASRLLHNDRLLTLLAEGAVVCTATQRLARHLNDQWDREMLRRKESVWETPRILPLMTWQKELVQRASLLAAADRSAGSARLLTAAQERISWERAVREELTAHDMQPELLARQLMDAHQLQQSWDVSDEEIQRYPTPGSELYLRALAFVRELWNDLGVLPAGGLSRYARNAAEQFPALLPPSLVLAGFDLYPDSMFRAFQSSVRNHGVSVTHWERGGAASSPSFLRYESFEEEIDAAAIWSREMLQHGSRDVAIVLPSLDHVRDQVERRFSDILAPGQVLHGHDAETGLFELSLGKRCADEPMMAAALHAIELLQFEIPLESLSALLRGPFTAANEKQRRKRIDLDMRLRGFGVPSFSKRFLNRIIGDSEQDDILLQALAQQADTQTGAEADVWAQRFIDMLKRLGWPGSRSLTSREYQGRRRMGQLLEEFSTYAPMLPGMQAGEAISRFRALVQEQIFQPESTGAPVQIMGVLETAGMRMEHCRVIGMNEERWPPPMRTNAFIPLPVQRRAGITDILPDQYLQQMRELTRRTENIANEVIYSCSAREADKELLPSPLLRHIPCSEDSCLHHSLVSVVQDAHPDCMEELGQDEAPPLEPAENIRGGTRILSLQSACPFRAFAELRLHADAPAEPLRGVQLRDRGTVMHRLLELFWKERRSQRALLNMSEEDVRERLSQLLDQVLEERQHPLRGDLPGHVEEAERSCILDILTEWLRSERRREHFTVREVERETRVSIGELEFGIVADRIDEVGDHGRILLIDYKSGQQGPGNWTGERLGDPQLPLYAVKEKSNIAGLAFGILRRGECRLSGLSDDHNSIDSLPPAAEWMQKRGIPVADWDELIQFWNDGLHRLAEEFVQGKADVQPRDGEETCRYCSLRHLCRIDAISEEAEQ